MGSALSASRAKPDENRSGGSRDELRNTRGGGDGIVDNRQILHRPGPGTCPSSACELEREHAAGDKNISRSYIDSPFLYWR